MRAASANSQVRFVSISARTSLRVIRHADEGHDDDDVDLTGADGDDHHHRQQQGRNRLEDLQQPQQDQVDHASVVAGDRCPGATPAMSATTTAEIGDAQVECRSGHRLGEDVGADLVGAEPMLPAQAR